jgi:UDP-glucose 4-epimerase
MKIVVFGGAGFLGSHVCDALTGHGHNVTVFDARKSGYLLKGQKMVTGNILDEQLVNKTVKQCDAVYNFAGIADIDECVKRPLDTVKYNVLGNSIVLEAARLANIKRYLFASSSYVYSNYGSFYKSSKQASELFIHSYNEKYKLPYTILRYGSLYGDRADGRNTVYRILKEALEKGRITYHGTGEEVREYIHVRDAAELSVKMLSPEFGNVNVMLTGPSPMRYKDILEMIREIMGNKVKIVYTNKSSETHYKLSPYNYKKPEIGRKIFNNHYIELGVGLLECLEDISAGK